ncbi:MAG: RimK family alpha-L-glutamate ligase [Methanobacteriota archaeon]
MHFGFIPKDEDDEELFSKSFKKKKVKFTLLDESSQWINSGKTVETGFFKREQSFKKFMKKDFARLKKESRRGDIPVSDLDLIFMRKLDHTYSGSDTEQSEFTLDFLELIEKDLPVVNPVAGIRNACRKHMTNYLLARQGLPTPASFAANDPVRAFFELDRIGFPQYIKPVEGGGGSGVFYVKDWETAGDLTSVYGLFEKPLILQEVAGGGREDIRVVVVGEHVIGAIKRRTPKGMHKSNVTVGGKPSKMRVDDELGELALKATKAVGCKISGVDIVKDKQGYKILEVNASPGFTGFKKATRIPVEHKIVDYLISEARS